MTIIYKHEAPETDCYDTRHIVAEELCDGSTEITITVGEPGPSESWMRHILSIAETDKFGAVLCKDIIDNYKEHAADLKDRIAELENIMTDMEYNNIELQHTNAMLEHTLLAHDKVHASIVEGLQLQLGDLRHMVRERNHTINNAAVEHNIHSEQLYTRIEELEARNKELVDDGAVKRVWNGRYYLLEVVK